MTETPDALTNRFEAIRRAMAVVAADRPTPEQIAEWNADDREMAKRIRAAVPGVPLHHAYAVLRALRVTQRLEAAAAPPAAVPSAPAHRAAILREAAEVAVRAARGCGDSETGQYAASVAAGIGKELRRMAGEAQQPEAEAVVEPHCDGFPSACPNPINVPPAPPHHDGGIRCGCYDEEPTP